MFSRAQVCLITCISKLYSANVIRCSNDINKCTLNFFNCCLSKCSMIDNVLAVVFYVFIFLINIYAM